MVTVTDLSVAYGAQVVLDGVSLTIDRGARIALCGANGSGKSTLMRIIAGHGSADRGRVIARRGVSIAYLAQSGVEHSGRTLHEELTLAFAAELAAERELRQVEEEMAAAGDGARLDRLLERYAQLTERVSADGAAERAARLDRVSRGLGFRPRDADQETSAFSSGWQMRIALAKLLLRNSDLLLLDEPSNYLDLEARQWLEGYLRTYPGGFLLVAHDRTLLDRTCDRVAEIYRGRLRTWPGLFSEYLQRRAAELEQMAAAYERQQEEIARMEAFVRKFRANASKARLVQSRLKQLERLPRLEPPPVQSHLSFSFPPAPPGGRRALGAAGLSLAYGSRQVIRDLDLELDRGDRLALLGDNGAGKSTLLRALAGAAPLAAGQVVLGTGVTVGYYAQDRAEQLTGSHCVLEDVEAVAPGEMMPRLRNLLGAFLFSGDDVFKPLRVLSGGERSRVALVRLLLQPANLLLLDEPTSHLDLSAIGILTQALRRYAGTLVFASHDEYFIAQLATKVLEVTRDQVRLYHGGWDYFQWKRSAGAAAPTPPALTPPPGGRDAAAGRAPRRPRSGARRAAGRLRGERAPEALRRRQQALLDELDRLQQTERRLQDQLGDPAVYPDGARVRDLKRKLQANGRAQQAAAAAWEEVERTLEGAGATTV